jgi:two-component system, chemotaxis family, protein-glutamate methylesterase/glutaminase
MHAERSIEAVVMGASTGGVEALIALLKSIQRDFRPTILIVMHIPPMQDALLVDVLQPNCLLPLSEAQDKEPIEQGTVYVAPPGYHLLVEPSRSLALSVDEPVNFCRPSIDLLFESAAYAYGEKLLGIVLTGANEDGARGLKAIRSAGGLAWVQEPQTAVSGVMPESAIACAGADRVLPLLDMASELAALGRPG